MTENKFWKQAMEELSYLSGDEHFQREVEARAGFLMDQDVREREAFKDGKNEGKEEGKKQKQLEIAKKMKAKNMPINEIIELTNSTKEEIEKL